MTKYVFDEGVIIKGAKDADPQAIGEALEAIAAGSAGRLKPEEVVAAARSPNNVLHRHFEWDDAVAAESYRLDQARAIVRIVRVADAAYDDPPRAFITVTDAVGRSYRGLSEVARSADLQLAVLKSARAELAAFQRRYRSLTEVCALVAIAEQAADNLAQDNRAAA